MNVTPGTLVRDILYIAGLAKTKTEARRLITQGGVRLDGVKVAGIDSAIVGGEQPGLAIGLLTVGKKRVPVTVIVDDSDWIDFEEALKQGEEIS